MPGPLAPALIAAGANIVGSGLSAWQSRRNVDKTNIANQQLAEYTFNKNLEMWKLQNQYNSPQAQMQRLQEAGLNPHLMYGKGTVGNAQSMPSYVAPQVDYRGKQAIIGNMAQAGLSTMAQMYDVDKKKEELNQSLIQTQYERMFKIPLGDISVKTAAANLNQTQIVNAIKEYERDVQKIQLNDYWKKGSNPNDPALYREGLNIIKEVLENTSTDIANQVTKNVTPVINTLGKALEIFNYWTIEYPSMFTNEIKREWKETELMYQEFKNWWNNWRNK